MLEPCPFCGAHVDAAARAHHRRWCSKAATFKPAVPPESIELPPDGGCTCHMGRVPGTLGTFELVRGNCAVHGQGRRRR